ncbi:MAG: hypothetical protein II461_07880 [Treponema sp.]|nr:hypothetical protein [Treponema sp.]
MTVEEIKQKSSQMFSDYLNYVIEDICGVAGNVEFFPMVVMTNNSRFSDTLKEHAQDMVDIFVVSKNKTGRGFSLDMESVNTRSSGRKSIIKQVYFSTEADYLDFINVRQRVETLKAALTGLVQENFVSSEHLCEWAKKHVRDLTVEHPEGLQFWHNIALCVRRISNPNEASSASLNFPPDFIDANKTLIHSLCPEKNQESETESEPAEEPSRDLYAVSESPARTFLIRFRSLSRESPLKLGRLTPEEIALTLDDFTHLNQTTFLRDIDIVLIVKSESVFKTFPCSEHVFCIFGPDYAVNTLKLCDWLKRFKIVYFGDIDEHSFDVISTFRNTFPDAKSLCLDMETWKKFRTHGESGGRLKNDAVPKNMTDEETQTFESLRAAKVKNHFSQDRIPPEYMLEMLELLRKSAD